MNRSISGDQVALRAVHNALRRGLSFSDIKKMSRKERDNEMEIARKELEGNQLVDPHNKGSIHLMNKINQMKRFYTIIDEFRGSDVAGPFHLVRLMRYDINGRHDMGWHEASYITRHNLEMML